MEPSSQSALLTQESERKRLKGPHIIQVRSTDTFLFINSEEKRKKKSRVSLPRLPSCKPRANSNDLYSLPSKVQQFVKAERMKESKTSNVLTRDVSHLQDIIAKLPTERDRNYKEVIVGMQDSNYFLSTDIRYLQKLLHNSDDLGIPITTNHFGLTERLNCRKESCIEWACQQKHKFKSQTPSPLRSPRIDGDKFINKILKSEVTPEKKPRLKFVSLGNPTGRQDVENLKKWLAYMQEEYLADIDDSINNRVDEEKQEMVYTIYYTTLKELIRQVSVHCVERGELLQETIEKLTRHWSITSKASVELLQKQRLKHKNEMNELKNLHARHFVKYQSKLNRVNEKLENSKVKEEKLNKELESYKELIVDLQKKYKNTKSELKRYKNMTNAERKAETIRQGYQDGSIRRTRIVLDTIKTSETPPGNETDPVTQENAELLNAVDVALQTEEVEYDLLFPEQHTELAQIEPKKHKVKGKLRQSEALSVSAKIASIMISETSSLSISPQILAEVSKNEANQRSLHIRKNTAISEILSSLVRDPQLSSSPECQQCKRRLNAPTRKNSYESSSTTKSSSRKNAMRSGSLISVPEDTDDVNSSRLIKQTKAATGSEAQSIYSYTSSTIKKISDILSTVTESKYKDLKKTPRKNGSSPTRASKKSANSRAKEKEEEEALRDSIQQSIDDMIIKEVIRQQTALVEVNRKIKSKKEELDELESQVTSRSQHLKKLESHVNSAMPEDSKLDKPDARVSVLDKYAGGSSQSNPKMSDSNSRSELGKNSVVESMIKLEPVRNSTISESDSITNTVTNASSITHTSKETKSKNELSKISRSDSMPEINTELSSDSLNFARKLSKRFELSDSVPELDKSVNFLNLIPQGSDVKAWKAGFNVGYDQGKKEAHNDDADLGFEKGFARGYKKGISERGLDYLPDKSVKSMTHTDFKLLKGCESIDEAEEISDSENRTTSRTQLESSSPSFGSKDKVSKRRKSTRISEFNFRTQDSVIRKKPAKKIMNAFLTNKRKAIINYASIGKNMLLRLISSIYQTAVARVASGEYFESLIDLLYEDILNKYGFKNLADRKYKEFIASSIFRAEHLRVKMLIKLLGIGYAIDERSYSDLTCRLYMELLHYMHHTHIGIIVASDDSADKQMYPSLRAYECLKEKLEPVLERSVMLRIASMIENNSVPDPKRINKSGLVELELFLEYVCEAYEEYQDGIYEGLELAICTIYHDTQPKYITKTDAFFLVRSISPQKYSTIVREVENEPQYEGRAEDKFISMRRFRKLCVLNSCLSLKDMHSIYKPGHVSSLSPSSISKLSKAEALSILGSLTDLQESKFRTYSSSRWKKMIEDHDSLSDPDLHNLQWKMIESEVSYLRSERGK